MHEDFGGKHWSKISFRVREQSYSFHSPFSQIVYISPPARKDSDGVLSFYISCIHFFGIVGHQTFETANNPCWYHPMVLCLQCESAGGLNFFFLFFWIPLIYYMGYINTIMLILLIVKSLQVTEVKQAVSSQRLAQSLWITMKQLEIRLSQTISEVLAFNLMWSFSRKCIITHL